MEVGVALELQKNGHFRYQLDYGAVSEQADGDWTLMARWFASPQAEAELQPRARPRRARSPGDLAMTLEPPALAKVIALMRSGRMRNRVKRAS